MKTIISKFTNMHNWLASKTVINAIPKRVNHDLKKHQLDSEKLIGWTQLSIVVVFTLLYSFSPKAFSDSATFTPVPWFLGAYFIFTVLRLILSYKFKLGFSVLIISIIVDIALLFALIYSFHIQYNQPASFYLKAPTLLYIFIFIALRALRFEPGFVVFSGIVASIGWLGMSYYAATATGMENITRDYVEYLTSNTILIGAELDKVISIIMVTAILTAVIIRGQKFLIQAIHKSTTTDDLSRFVPEVIAEQIKHEDHQFDLHQTQTGQCSILFVDLEGFTSISESMSPKKLVTTLNDYFALAAKPIHQFGGVINQFQGDAILASFNIPKQNPEHAYNAIKAALTILERLNDTPIAGVNLKVRIGINTGTAIGGLVGIPERLNYTVHGDDVNIAQRLEQLNKNFNTQLLISEQTKLSAGERFNYKLITEDTLKGRRHPLLIYTVT